MQPSVMINVTYCQTKCRWWSPQNAG